MRKQHRQQIERRAVDLKQKSCGFDHASGDAYTYQTKDPLLLYIRDLYSAAQYLQFLPIIAPRVVGRLAAQQAFVQPMTILYPPRKTLCKHRTNGRRNKRPTNISLDWQNLSFFVRDSPSVQGKGRENRNEPISVGIIDPPWRKDRASSIDSVSQILRKLYPWDRSRKLRRIGNAFVWCGTFGEVARIHRYLVIRL